MLRPFATLPEKDKFFEYWMEPGLSSSLSAKRLVADKHWTF